MPLRRALLPVACLAACAAGLSGAANLRCPTQWQATAGGCLRAFSEPETFWGAEAACQRQGGRLFTLKDMDDAVGVLYDADGAWVGGAWDRRAWSWTDGTTLAPVLHAHVAAIGGNEACVGLRQNASGPEAHTLFRHSCQARMPYICMRGGQGCAWRSIELSLAHAWFNEVEVDAAGVEWPVYRDVTIHPFTDIISVDGVERGIGRWTTESSFLVENPLDGEACTWVATFSYTDDTPMVMTGCVRRGALEGAVVGQLRCRERTEDLRLSDNAQHSIEENWDDVSRPFRRVDVEEDKPSGSYFQDEYILFGLLLWVLLSGLVVVGVASRRKRQRMRDEAMAPAAPDAPSPADRNVPQNRNPLVNAIPVVPPSSASVSASADSDAATADRTSYDPQSECPTVSYWSGEGTDMTGDSSTSFDSMHAAQRLARGHKRLKQAFERPLRIHKVECYHQNAQHIHHFYVENALESAALAVLSTAYARSRPRLPRGTRIHIERVGGEPSSSQYEASVEAPAPPEAASSSGGGGGYVDAGRNTDAEFRDFVDDMAYYADAFF